MSQLPSQSQFGDYGEWPGRDVLDSDGERLGDVREIYLDRETGQPEWVLVDLPGDEARFVPLADATVEGSTIRVAHSAATIRSAPGIGTEPRIDQSEERRLYDHYGIGYSTDESASGLPADEPTTREQDATPASWSDAAKDDEADNAAPPPAEPPSPDELEQAQIPEPPAATDRAADEEPDIVSPSAAGPSAEPDVQEAPEPLAPADFELVSPSATSGPAEVFTAPAEPELEPEPSPPPAPEPPKAATPPPAPEPPRDTPPAPEPGGALAAVKNRKAGVAAGVSIAAVLLLIIRRLR